MKGTSGSTVVLSQLNRPQAPLVQVVGLQGCPPPLSSCRRHLLQILAQEHHVLCDWTFTPPHTQDSDNKGSKLLTTLPLAWEGRCSPERETPARLPGAGGDDAGPWRPGASTVETITASSSQSPAPSWDPPASCCVPVGGSVVCWPKERAFARGRPCTCRSTKAREWVLITAGLCGA